MLRSRKVLEFMFTSKAGQNQYSLIFILVILSSSLFTMFKSMKNGIAGFEDNFYNKSLLIASFNKLRYLMGNNVFPQVLVGKEGWLEYSLDGNLDDYQNIYPDQVRLQGIHRKLTSLDEDLKARNIKLIVVVAPNKSTIYPDKVSDELHKLSDRSRLDLFLELFNQPNSPVVIDLRPFLAQARQDQQLYYKTDTHWNSFGAHIAYREIMNSAMQTYPDLQPYKLDQFILGETDPQIMELGRLLGVEFLTESRNTVTPRFDSGARFQRFPPFSPVSMSWSNNEKKRKLLMYHDSFGVALQVFLQHHFQEAMYILNSPDVSLSNMSWINTIEPDVVIIEILERNLYYLDDLLSNQ